MEKTSSTRLLAHSGAKDHMTHSSWNFSTYYPSRSSRKIATANGSLITVDQGSSKMIGHANEKDGLYYLETSSDPSIISYKSPLSYLSKNSPTKGDQLRLWLFQDLYPALSHRCFYTMSL